MQLGMQFYSLRREAEADLRAALASVPGLGYSAIELANPHGWGGWRWRDELGQLGLAVVGAHVRMEDLEGDWAARVAFQRELGNRRLVVPVPQAGWETAGREEYRETARRLNALGARAADEGLELAYHNHHWEFADYGDGEPGCGMGTLLGETDPELVGFEVDTAWTTKGGWDVVEFLHEHASRVSMVHAKEYRAADDSEPPMGEGDVDFPSVVKLCAARRWPLVVEYESEPAPEGLAHSARCLQQLLD